MNKKYIIIVLIVMGIITSALTAKAFIYNNCNYDEESGNYIADNKVYAHGTMDSAFRCALYGVLPQVIIDRLGIFGDVATKEKAKEIIKTNEENQKKE